MIKMAVHIQQDWKWNTGIIWALQLLHSPYSHYQSHSSLYEFKLHVRHINTTHEIRIVNIPTAKMLQGNYLELPKMRNTLLNTAHLYLLY